MSFSLFVVAMKNLRRKSFRTAVLIISIALLVSILVFGASFILSVGSSLKRASDRLGADLLVVPMGARDFAAEVLLETKTKAFYMDRSVVDRVKEVEGVKETTCQTYLTTILGVCCDIASAKVVAFDQDTDFIVKPWLKKAIGRDLKKGEAIIGYQANADYELLDVSRSVLFGTEFQFVGVLEKTGTGLDNAIFLSDDNIPDIIRQGKSGLGSDQISLIFVNVKDGYDPAMVARDIEGQILEVDTTVRSDMGKDIIATLADINKVFLITIALASVLSTFLTWTIFSAIVNERFREVGIMRAIGARGSHIMRMFVMEVLLLGAVGSVLGIVLGTYLSLTLSRIFTLLREMAAGLTVLERMEVGLLGLAVGVGICVVGALSSIIRIRKLEPLEALKEV
ncbi:MAG: FtsX-like permease family protein [Thermodesulfovibrionales bacterium]